MEMNKKRVLFRNIKGDSNLRFLIQLCKDQKMFYQKAATYLRVYGAEMDKEFQDSRKTNKIEKEEGDKYLIYEETREVLNTMANENGLVRAFKVLRDTPRVRESLHINAKIWQKLSEEVQAVIRAIREEIKPSDKKEAYKPKHYHLNMASIEMLKRLLKRKHWSTL